MMADIVGIEVRIVWLIRFYVVTELRSMIGNERDYFTVSSHTVLRRERT